MYILAKIPYHKYLSPSFGRTVLIQLVHALANFTENNFFDFSHFEWVNWGQSWTKNATFGYVLLSKKMSF